MQENKYRTHVLLDAKDRGDCRTLCGKVVITFILADDDSGAWNDPDITEFKRENLEAGQKLIAESRRYGGNMQLFLNYVRCKVKGSVSIKNYEGWIRSALSSAGLPDETGANGYFARRYAADEAPVIFCVNYRGRAFASPAYGASGFEYAVLYKGNADFRHELFHIFGAKDYYYPDLVKAEAEKYFPDSVMLKGSGCADPLTAYLVGWCDAPAREAQAFLDATSSVTEKDIRRMWEDTTFTGYTSIPYGDGTYTGQLEAGVPNGRGIQVYSGGSVYDGQWDHGNIEGYGTFKWSDGAVYSGNWHDNKYNGDGVIKYADGASYTGQFRDGVFCGSGIMKYRNGAVYDGGWSNGERDGYGVLVYGDGGSVYMGEWKSGEINGHGAMRYKGGSDYEGEWFNGKYHGRGRLSYSDGTVLEGRWMLGEYKGR